MKILVLNCGSSSIKYALYNMDDKSVITSGGIEKIGSPDSFIKLKVDGKKVKIDEPIPEHTRGVQFIFELLTTGEYAVLESVNDINAVGHRMVHGGEKFNQSVVITDDVMRDFSACNDLAPLHNPANIKGINAVKALLPNVPQVGVFDTAFHQTMPDYAYMYALPYELYSKYGVRRYGFHGTSHRYVSQRVLEYLGREAEGTKIITCHIGNGASIAAVKDGKCIDTSMGLTPLEGLIMGTRSGDIDAGAVTFLMDKLNLDTKGISNLLNKQSGLVGVSELSNDFRDILAGIAVGNDKARLAKEMYTYRIKKYIGQYAAAMGGVDIILFTGGAGENQWEVREGATNGLEFLGVKMDVARNRACRATEAIISADDSQVTVCVIPTDEELMIATDTLALVEDILDKTEYSDYSDY
ncbi:MAG: acetate kinase [Bacteroidaceae bacterium]|nr:acetate kinase [Bacteroidaceae bacterium]